MKGIVANKERINQLLNERGAVEGWTETSMDFFWSEAKVELDFLCTVYLMVSVLGVYQVLHVC